LQDEDSAFGLVFFAEFYCAYNIVDSFFDTHASNQHSFPAIVFDNPFGFLGNQNQFPFFVFAIFAFLHVGTLCLRNIPGFYIWYLLAPYVRNEHIE
jgi:hypothetical protein